MYLKRIEAIGFKSFADKTIVQFEPGVTAVVGPNGSGKSNISDAIRWVLGEQSAKSLRGGKMEDIIFAGTSTRKALNFAEVALVLDNTCQTLAVPYEEVNVTRRVYRSGESEYLINKQKVRLKDVVDLIMDSGVGHDSLSIISQDRVKAIVESRTDERRVIIEEAAGVLKYKMRKKEASRRLNSTEDNLSRVADIIYELEGQVGPLKTQSEEAEKYLLLKEEASEAELSVLAYDLKTLGTFMEASSREKAELEYQHVSLAAKINIEEVRQSDLRSKRQAGDEAIQQSQKQLVETSELIQKLQGQREVLKERRKNAATNKEQLALEQGQLEMRLAAASKELAQGRKSVADIEAQLDEKNESLQDVSSRYEHLEENLKQQLEQARTAYFADLNELASTKNQYLSASGLIRKAEDNLERLYDSKETVLQEMDALHEEAAIFNKKYETIEGSLKDKRKEYQTLARQVNVKQQELTGAQDQSRQLENQWNRLSSRLQWLEDAQKDFSGFNEGAKRILKGKESGEISGIEGAVAQLVQVPQELETAMDVVLGPAMQQIVTRDDAAAKAAIAFLKKNRGGRATFLPLNVIKARYLPDQARSLLSGEEDVVGVASDLVGFDSRYRKIFENLLGGIIVTRTLEGANRLARSLSYRYRIVTLEGDVVNTGGSMTGGAVKRQGSGMLRQKNEAAECKAQLETMEAQIEAGSLRQRETREALKEAESQLSKAQAAGERLRERLSEVTQQKVAFEFRERAVQERLKELDEQEHRHRAEARDLARQTNQLAESRVMLEGRIETLKQEIESLESQLQQQEQLKSRLLQQITELRVVTAKLETSLLSGETNCRRLEGEAADAQSRLDELRNRVFSSESQLLGSGDETERVEAQIKEVQQQRDAIIETIQGLRQGMAHSSGELETLEREVREGHKIRQSLAETLNRLEVQMGKADVEMDVMLKKIEEEYQMTFDYVSHHYPLRGGLAETKAKIGRLKKEMGDLGEVNLGAVAEYQRVKERFEFLSTQRDDLLEAKTNLEATIDEMDQEMVVKFKETFDQVRVQYIEIFKQLFGGGNADLVLTDPHDLLNTGVEIIAQPPGTKLKTSNLLSGGQKALTSISLLFAILKIRTVPFCVLDEVEAALDEANVARYANYLKKFSDETQFIVITHRKGTMEKAHVLYGVTMQERGVTKLVSVRLEQINAYLDTPVAGVG